jgi:hypothetical protein
MSEKKAAARLSIDRSDLALEIVSIVIAIILATAVGQIVEHYREGVRTHEALVQIRQEIIHDDALLRVDRPLHRRVRTAFWDTVRKAHGEQLSFDDLMTETFGHAAPEGFHPFDGTTTAWELARTSSVLADVPYALRATLQTRYAELASLQKLNSAFAARLEGTPTDARPNFYFTSVSISLILTDLVYSEDRLVDDDSAALNVLASAGVR